MVIVLFKAKLREDVDQAEHDRTFERMLELVSAMPGFISVDGYSASAGGDLAVVRFESEEALLAWRRHPEHVSAQQRGRSERVLRLVPRHGGDAGPRVRLSGVNARAQSPVRPTLSGSRSVFDPADSSGLSAMGPLLVHR